MVLAIVSDLCLPPGPNWDGTPDDEPGRPGDCIPWPARTGGDDLHETCESLRFAACSGVNGTPCKLVGCSGRGGVFSPAPSAASTQPGDIGYASLEDDPAAEFGRCPASGGVTG